MRARVAAGDRRASPRLMTRMAASSSSAWALLPMNPLAPQRSAWNTYSSISKVVRMRLSEIAQTVDRAVIISAGRLRFDGQPCLPDAHYVGTTHAHPAHSGVPETAHRP